MYSFRQCRLTPRLWAVLLALAALAPAGGHGQTAAALSHARPAISFTATLAGINETPPNSRTGAGSGSFMLNEAQTQLAYTVSASGLSAQMTGAHFHHGAAGVDGPRIADIGVFTGTVSGTWDVTPDEVSALLAGDIYVNVHTLNHPGGELRGQVFPVLGAVQTISFTSVGAQDGWIAESSAGSGLGGLAQPGGNLLAGDLNTRRQMRSILSFYSAALPDDAVVVGAQLSLARRRTIGNVAALGPLWVDMQEGTFGAPGLEAADFQAVPGLPRSAMLPVPGQVLSGPVSDLGTALVNPLGYTQFRLAFENPTNGNNATDVIELFSGNSGNEQQRPALRVVYYRP